MKQISLAAARVNAGLTQQELAEKLGVTRKSIQNWELGKTQIRKANFIALCTITGFNQEDIFLPFGNP